MDTTDQLAYVIMELLECFEEYYINQKTEAA